MTAAAGPGRRPAAAAARPLRVLVTLAPVLVAALAVLPFVPALPAEFVHWDDDVNLVNNPHYRGLGARQIAWMFSTTLLGHWIPLTWLTFGLNYAVGGMDPLGYHLVQRPAPRAEHGLLWLIARRLIAAADGPALPTAAAAAGAAVAALVFAVHPLRAESVAWATQRRDVPERGVLPARRPRLSPGRRAGRRAAGRAARPFRSPCSPPRSPRRPW